jgi:hypothetical protein
MSVNTIFKKAMLSAAVFSISALSANVFAANMFTTKTASSLNCVTINNDLAQIEKFKQAGTYRFAKGGVKRINFDFASNKPFQDYLAAARAHINAQNPKTSMPCPISTPSMGSESLILQSQSNPINAINGVRVVDFGF